MRHAILGPGGVGGLIGAVLADAGEHVTLLVRPGTEALYPREILLESPLGNLRAPVSISAPFDSSVDVLWVTVKAPHLRTALESIPANFQAQAIVPLLNGIDHIEYLRSRFDYERVIPATIGVESERTSPGRIVHHSPFVRLAISESGRERLTPVLQIFQRFGFDCSILHDETTLMWSKLVFLAPVALSTSAARSPLGEVLGNSQKAAGLEASVREACTVATQSGAKVDAEAVLARIRSLPAAMRSSMERDITGGHPSELDAIAGPILRGAQKYHLVLKVIPELAGIVASYSPKS